MNLELHEPGDFWEAFHLLKLEDHWNDPGIGTLMHGLKAIMDNPKRACSRSGTTGIPLKHLQAVLDF